MVSLNCQGEGKNPEWSLGSPHVQDLGIHDCSQSSFKGFHRIQNAHPVCSTCTRVMKSL